jgi:hypothetical protein
MACVIRSIPGEFKSYLGEFQPVRTGSPQKEKGRGEEVPAFSYERPEGGGSGRFACRWRGGGLLGQVYLRCLTYQATLSSFIAFSKTFFMGLVTSSVALVETVWKSFAFSTAISTALRMKEV